jgi:hypothetical protein
MTEKTGDTNMLREIFEPEVPVFCGRGVKLTHHPLLVPRSKIE